MLRNHGGLRKVTSEHSRKNQYCLGGTDIILHNLEGNITDHILIMEVAQGMTQMIVALKCKMLSGSQVPLKKRLELLDPTERDDSSQEEKLMMIKMVAVAMIHSGAIFTRMMPIGESSWR